MISWEPRNISDLPRENQNPSNMIWNDRQCDNFTVCTVSTCDHHYTAASQMWSKRAMLLVWSLLRSELRVDDRPLKWFRGCSAFKRFTLDLLRLIKFGWCLLFRGIQLEVGPAYSNPRALCSLPLWFSGRDLVWQSRDLVVACRYGWLATCPRTFGISSESFRYNRAFGK